MNTKPTRKPLALLFVTAMFASLFTSSIVMADTSTHNPFAMTEASNPVQLSDMGKDGKCGGDKAMKDGKHVDGKDMKDGKCGSDKAMKDGKCGGDKAMKDNKCGGDKAMKDGKGKKDGKCGTGKCGDSK